MKKIAVIGGAGFIGSYVTQELLQRNYEVVAADLSANKFIPEHVFSPVDIMNPEQLESLFSDTFDAVIQLAGFASLDDSVQEPYATLNLNIMGNLNVLEALRKKAFKGKFIYASSMYAGNPKGAFYGISKMSSEKIVEEYGKKFGLNWSILRYGSVYGDRNFHNNYIYNLIREAIETGNIEHEGDGNEVREYIHALDTAKLTVDVMENDSYLGKKIILTGMERMRRVELFEMIKEILGGDVQIALKNSGYQHHYKMTPHQFTPEIHQKLVANPYIEMGQGLLEVVKSIYKNDGKED